MVTLMTSRKLPDVAREGPPRRSSRLQVTAAIHRLPSLEPDELLSRVYFISVYVHESLMICAGYWSTHQTVPAL